jgi:F0F1-type ATP synthase membrane subunit c/vacuolar-type H+-ATPase subunit K
MDWKSKDVGTKDMIIGFGMMGAAALVAVVLAIILSLN